MFITLWRVHKDNQNSRLCSTYKLGTRLARGTAGWVLKGMQIKNDKVHCGHK
jgi:hypothetical protein